MMRAALPLITLLLPAALATSRAPAPPAAPLAPSPGPVTQEAEAPLPDTEPPPGLSPADRGRVERAVKSLRNSNPAARAKVEEEVIAFGRGAIPELIDAAGTTHAGKRAGLARCLVALLDLRDRELIVELVQSDNPLLREVAARKIGDLQRPELVHALDALADDDVDAVRTEAALALAQNGHDVALGLLVDIWSTEQEDGLLRERILAAMPGLADTGTHSGLAMRLKLDPQREREDPAGAAQERRAAIAMLHGIGDAPAVTALLRALDDPHNVVQRDAIDALRDLLEDKPPFDSKSTFQQINEVERLKKLGGARR